MDDVPICKELLRETYSIIEKDSHEDIPKVNEFNSYPDELCMPYAGGDSSAFPRELWENYRIDKTFEVQVRTTFSEGWHEVDHDVRYKHKEEWEEHYEFSRELNGIYATLEICDRSMVNLLERLAYKNYKNMQIEAMLRNKFRLRFENPVLSVPLMEVSPERSGSGKETLSGGQRRSDPVFCQRLFRGDPSDCGQPGVSLQ